MPGSCACLPAFLVTEACCGFEGCRGCCLLARLLLSHWLGELIQAMLTLSPPRLAFLALPSLPPLHTHARTHTFSLVLSPTHAHQAASAPHEVLLLVDGVDEAEAPSGQMHHNR